MIENGEIIVHPTCAALDAKQMHQRADSFLSWGLKGLYRRYRLRHNEFECFVSHFE